MTDAHTDESGTAGEIEADIRPQTPTITPIPTAVPFALTTAMPSHQVSDSLARSTPRKNASTTGRIPTVTGAQRRSGRRTGRQQLDQLASRLSQRDLAVVAAIQRHRFLATSQAERLLFTEHASPLSASRTARRVIRRLADGGLIRHLDRRMGGMVSGSAEHVWTVTEAGHRLLAARADQPGVKATAISGDTRRHRFHEPSERLLKHCLAITETALVLVELGRRTAAMGEVSLQLEPASWRRYEAYGGGRTLIRPDLTAVTVTAADDGQAYEDHWFFEVDLGTEHPPTLLNKCREYMAYRRSGVEQARLEVFPVVVWVMDRPARRDVLATALGSTLDIDERLFRVVTVDELPAVILKGAE